MTRAVRERVHNDVNDHFSDHLRNHLHLTNCIHLKNHMHKHSPILSDKALNRDLAVLQRTRSLRDPSASPQSWHSPFAVDKRLRGTRKDAEVRGRHSFGLDDSREASKSLAGRVNRYSDVNVETDFGKDPQENVADKYELRSNTVKLEGTNTQESHLKNLSGQLKDVNALSDDALKAEVKFHSTNKPTRPKRHKFRGARRTRPLTTIRDVTEAQKDLSLASNSAAQGRDPKKYTIGEENDDQNMNVAAGGGCGIPWNWSSIHDRGKSFLDMAGRHLYRGLSESRFKKGSTNFHGITLHDMPVMSENSRSSTKSPAGEFLPLLDASGSQGSMERFPDFSGELRIFSDNPIRQEGDSDHMSVARSSEKHKSRKQLGAIHQNFTQKYMPRTFRDLVGQPLVVQALSNAVAKRKIGFLYLFYGTHGTGKTSCARIFARSLNCQSREHPRPCGVCNSCIRENTGKYSYVMEIGPFNNMDVENITKHLNRMASSQPQFHYRVFIIDECDTLSAESWNTILKVIDLAPRRVVFIFVCPSVDAIPHAIISRCQKFFFPKLKDADTVSSLQWIAMKEAVEVDKDALKLIALRSDGSLRDAEMTLEQLSLLGKQISLDLVQQLVGLVSDERLVDLLDLALSADTVNTVKNLRDIMESGVEPLALMSQLATVITDILSGSFDFTKGIGRRKFFRCQTLSKDAMEKLRQALRTLSQAEQQLRVSTDRITWLTAALLQLAPDQQYILPSSSGDMSQAQSLHGLDDASLRERQQRKSNAERGNDGKLKLPNGEDKESREIRDENVLNWEIEEIWMEVLRKISVDAIREFLYQEARLVSAGYGQARNVQLVFNSPLLKTKAEKFRIHILQAFESVLGPPVTLEILCEPGNDSRLGPFFLTQTNNNFAPPVNTEIQNHRHEASTSTTKRSEIVDVEASSSINDKDNAHRRSAGSSSSYTVGRNESLSLVKRKVSLAHVIQRADFYSNRSWANWKAANKLELHNLKLESRSRRLSCWQTPKVTRSKWKGRTRKPRALLKLIACGRCLS